MTVVRGSVTTWTFVAPRDRAAPAASFASAPNASRSTPAGTVNNSSYGGNVSAAVRTGTRAPNASRRATVGAGVAPWLGSDVWSSVTLAPTASRWARLGLGVALWLGSAKFRRVTVGPTASFTGVTVRGVLNGS